MTEPTIRPDPCVFCSREGGAFAGVEGLCRVCCNQLKRLPRGQLIRKLVQAEFGREKAEAQLVEARCLLAPGNDRAGSLPPGWELEDVETLSKQEGSFEAHLYRGDAGRWSWAICRVTPTGPASSCVTEVEEGGPSRMGEALRDAEKALSAWVKKPAKRRGRR